ncbi:MULTISPECIES: DUF433 domain-containing protein [Streptomyces]|uniref:DUF433 domain-containing protein n=1 Tax=Streptomyces TaxID=1883 RepID=UPI0029AFFD6A|nr:DUF433 domain-containing protein [Streptomyces stelliscabiei]MDX2520607.1 DUF433 domain-containing protein [Streptomyces stelliscabiei]MDX2552704.1 DUF433 domain-containing protein [Streptomyces stelliscabiei]MDX2661388.1 DUF433 domain-containing protein [Streptomyces stelliscabiei]MDX2788869.1 DUF433 domain-containing protein [Streptomyces stelliscabiei]
MSYEPKLAAALTGATLRQLAHWRNPAAAKGALLIPEVSAERPILYSFRDLIALRLCVQMRKETSLHKIRDAVRSLRVNLGEREHLSTYRLVADGHHIYLVEPAQATDLLHGGNGVIHQVVDALKPFYRGGRHIPDLYQPRDHLRVDEDVRGGEPVIDGTRIPAADVAALVRDGIAPERIVDFYPGVSAAAARDALDFSDYVDSYGNNEPRQGAA